MMRMMRKFASSARPFELGVAAIDGADTIATPAPGANVPGANVAAIVGAGSVRIGVVTGVERGRRTTGERDAERCKDRAQKNPTAKHGCLSAFRATAVVPIE